MTYRLPKLLQLARGAPCLIQIPGVCRGRNEPVVACHARLYLDALSALAPPEGETNAADEMRIQCPKCEKPVNYVYCPYCGADQDQDPPHEGEPNAALDQATIEACAKACRNEQKKYQNGGCASPCRGALEYAAEAIEALFAAPAGAPTREPEGGQETSATVQPPFNVRISAQLGYDLPVAPLPKLIKAADELLRRPVAQEEEKWRNLDFVEINGERKTWVTARDLGKIVADALAAAPQVPGKEELKAAYCEGYEDALKDKAPQVSGWIAVSERLPEEKAHREHSGDTVSRWMAITDGIDLGIANFHWPTNSWNPWPEFLVTHWMPLPQAPAPREGGARAERAVKPALAEWFRANKSRLKEWEAGDESGWLIEVKHNQFTLWWRSGHDPWENYGEPRWTRDAFKAVRFCRKEDAEAVITAWGAAVPNAFPTSHGFFAARKET